MSRYPTTARAIPATAMLACLLGATALPAVAQSERSDRVEVLHGLPNAEPVSVVRDEGGSGVTVYRGTPGHRAAAPARPVAAGAATGGAVAYIDGQRIRVDSLEPAGDWFIDRSGGGLVVMHCYTRQSVYAGGGRRILCDARRFR